MSAPGAAIVNPHAAESAQRFHRATYLIGQATDRVPEAASAPPGPIALPCVEPAAGPALEQVIARRRTRRDFDARKTLSVEGLARLLVLSAGRTALAEPGSWAPPSGHRAVPSAGATYPVSVHLIARRVAGLAPGIYEYAALDHTLLPGPQGTDDDLLERSTLDQPWMRGAAAVFVLVGTLERIAPRYASRGYRYMLFEAGHVAQNLYLLGTAHGLCVQATGGFIDDAITRMMGLDVGRDPLYLLAVGP